MIIRASRPTENFYCLDKSISEDRRLSWAARGLLIFLLGKPDHWRVCPSALMNETAQSKKPSRRDAVYGLLTELQCAGYVVRVQGRGNDGAMQTVDYFVKERWATPQTENPEAARHPGLPYPAEPLPANPLQVSTEKKQGLKDKQGHEEEAKSASASDAVAFDSKAALFCGITPHQIERWIAAYPATDVVSELLRAAEWLVANPSNRKSNYLRFLTSWLARAQDRAPRARHGEFRAQARRPSAHDERVDFIARLTGRRPQGDDGIIDLSH